MARSRIAGLYDDSSFLWNLHTVVYQFTFPPAVYEGSLFSTLYSAFVVCRPFNDDHFAHCEVVPHCSFYLHFKHLFICVLAITSMLSLEKYLSDLLPIFPIGLFVLLLLLLLSFMSYLYILEIKPLSVTLFENIFSHSVSFCKVRFVYDFPLLCKSL